MCSNALESIGKADDRVVPTLLVVAGLPDEDGQVCSKALDVLQYRLGPDGTVIEGLKKLLRSRSVMARYKSAEVLGNFRPGGRARSARFEPLAARRKPRSAGCSDARLLGSIGPAARAAIPELVRHLDDGDSSWLDSPASALAQIGPDAVPARQGNAAEPQAHGVKPVSRGRGVEGGRTRPQAAVPELVKMLADGSGNGESSYDEPVSTRRASSVLNSASTQLWCSRR